MSLLNRIIRGDLDPDLMERASALSDKLPEQGTLAAVQQSIRDAQDSGELAPVKSASRGNKK